MWASELGHCRDRSVGKDIGNVEGCVLAAPTLNGYELPDPLDPRFFDDIPAKIERFPNRFRVLQIGFSLYERAWTLRGMENLMMDFYDRPEFVHALLDAIADYNIAQVQKAVKYDIDAVYFGDDWGQVSISDRDPTRIGFSGRTGDEKSDPCGDTRGRLGSIAARLPPGDHGLQECSPRLQGGCCFPDIRRNEARTCPQLLVVGLHAR